MGDDCCDYGRDGLSAKSPKKSPLALRMIFLIFATICGVYICSVCLKQTPAFSRPRIVHVDLTGRHCYNSRTPLSQMAFVHYPEPTNYSREECACNPVRFFAILSMQRSGSGWFETLLNSHINISSNGEVFSVMERRRNMSTILSTLDKVYNLDWFSSAAKNECTAAVGFKWMLNQGVMDHHKEISEYFTRRGISAIFLFRRNLLRRMVSVLANTHDRSYKLLNGTHKSHVHSEDEVLFLSLIQLSDRFVLECMRINAHLELCKSLIILVTVSFCLLSAQAAILASYKPRINVTSLVPELNQMEQAASDALNHFKSTRHIILFYEDLVRNRTKLTDVLKFLKVPKRKLVSRQVKIHRKPLHEQIENWNAVRDALKGTRYEDFLNADYQMRLGHTR